MRALALTSTLAAAGLALVVVSAAQAQSRRGPAGPGYGYVTAESRYSGDTITAPVRNGPAGRLEVRMPGGTWIECGRSCSDTLRRETIDFWRGRDNRGTTDGPGYLSWQFRF